MKPYMLKRLLRRLPHKPFWLKGPVVLQVELHNYCNEDCIYCNTGGFHNGEHGVLPRWQLATVLTQARDTIMEVRLFLNNEPTLTVKDAVSLTDALQLAKSICRARTVIYSNGATEQPQIYLDKNLDHIHLTISASTRETYQKVHGKDYFTKALHSYSYILKNKRRNQKVYVHFVEVKENLRELASWRKLFSTADGLIVSPLHNGYKQDASKQCLEGLDYKATIEAGTYKGAVASDLPCTCWDNLSVSCHGDLLQCCDAPYSLNYGKVGVVPVSEAWQQRITNNLNNIACQKCILKNHNYKK